MPSSGNILFAPPTLDDGMAVFRLIQRCPPLDTNSSYCNMLQCSHFATTSIKAELNGELAGFVSGYILPAQPDTLFIWQVAVDEKTRGMGLASRMLSNLLARCANVRFLETTITADNNASWALFKNLANSLSTDLQSSDWLDKATHFENLHDSEALVRIGPFQSNNVNTGP